MPELPEVETIRRRIASGVVGRTVASVECHDSRLQSRQAIGPQIEGQSVLEVGRRGKYLLFFLTGDVVLVSHMRMTGNWALEVGGDDRYVRVRIDFTDGSCLSYVDIRRFGTLEVFLNRDAEAFLGSRLGPEPLGKTFTSDFLNTALQRRTAAIKSVLLDQKVVAGMGNIYADEVLFRSRLHPSTPAYAVRRDEVHALKLAIRETLKCSISEQAKADFSSIGIPGMYGEGRRKLAVYGRMGQPCIVCGTMISKDQIAGRGTCFCRKCQAVGRTRGRRVRDK